jgi:hypothetical protein
MSEVVTCDNRGIDESVIQVSVAAAGQQAGTIEQVTTHARVALMACSEYMPPDSGAQTDSVRHQMQYR